MTEPPKICLTLTAETIGENISLAKKYADYVNLYELRADTLAEYTLDEIHDFPNQVPHPSILTVRKVEDGGKYNGDGQERLKILRLLDTFDYVDLEYDYRCKELKALAQKSGTTIIRSMHDFQGGSADIILKADDFALDAQEIPKIAFMPRSLKEITELFKIAKTLPRRKRILLAMGPLGAATRILAQRLGSYLTFTSPEELLQNTAQIGHIDPIALRKTYKIDKITEKTAITGVTGWPLKVTSSPQVHRAFYSRDNLDAVLVPMPAENIEDAIELAEVLGAKGLAVTIPHKEKLIPLLDKADNSVKSIGAANTVIWRDGQKLGTNTDAEGFTQAVTRFLGVDSLQGMRVAIVGAGGAARAIVYAVFKQNAIGAVFARNLEKAAEVADQYGFEAHTLDQLTPSWSPDLIVQCTSVGHGSVNPNDDPIPHYIFNGTEAVYDLVYNPPETPIMKRAKKAGCKVQSGMTMLIAQAELQHKEFFTN